MVRVDEDTVAAVQSEVLRQLKLSPAAQQSAYARAGSQRPLS